MTEEQGRDYLAIIERSGDLVECLDTFRENDRFGGPRVYSYGHAGVLSPTTLRYIKVMYDLRVLFGDFAGFDVCEIGPGYGGQCRIIDSFAKPSTYALVDIKPALALAQRFLDHFVLNAVVSYWTMNELPLRDYDLVVSNYAFSELPRPFQDVYLEKVLLRSVRGYMTYNQGNPPEFRTYAAEEAAALIPGARVLDEEPPTHPDNRVIVWG